MSSTSGQGEIRRTARIGKLTVRAPREGHPDYSVSVEVLEKLSRGLHGTQKWVFECDRAKKRKPSKAKGCHRASKKVGCPVEWHVIRQADGTWLFTEIGVHNHSGDVDCFTALSKHAIDAIQFLARQRHTAFQICSLLRGPNNVDYLRMFPGLSEDQLSIVTQAKVEQELNRMRRQQLSHPEEREAVKHLFTSHGNFFQDAMQIEEHGEAGFRVFICTEFQKAMLSMFGSFCLLDSVHSVIRNGMNQLTLMVIDEFGRGVPVGFALVSNEDFESWRNFLKFCFKRAGRDPKQTATMSDGDKTIINACSSWMGLGVERHLLCAFHMQQAIARRLKSSGSTAGFQGADKKRAVDRVVMALSGRIRKLRLVTTKEAFDDQSQALLRDLKDSDSLAEVRTYLGASIDNFCEYLQDHWLCDDRARLWAAFGRQDMPGRRGHDTTNLIENFFRLQKYSYATKRRLTRLEQHVLFLVSDVLDGVARNREDMVRGLTSSTKTHMTRNLDKRKEWLLGEEKRVPRIQIMDHKLGVARVQELVSNRFEYRYMCLADLSCSCGEAGNDVCIHLEALAHSLERGVDRDLLEAGVRMIEESKLVRGYPGTHRYTCQTIASMWLRAEEGESMRKRYVDIHMTPGALYCTCPVFSLNGGGFCTHLKACHKMETATCDSEYDDDDLLVITHPDDITAFRPTTPTTTLDDDPCTKHRAPDSLTCPRYRHDLEDLGQDLLKRVRRVRIDPAALATATRLLEDCKRGLEPLTGKLIDGYSEGDKEIHDMPGSSFIRQPTDRTHKVLNPNRTNKRKQDSSSVDQTQRW